MIIDPSGRGPTIRQLFVAGVVLIAVLALLLTLLMMRYRGDFEEKAPVTALLTTTGDGLPADADVKFRGVLVGQVEGVQVAAQGEIQRVQINMDPNYLDGVPSSVTARVVPSNIFAVTSVELIDNGPATPLETGAEIPEDKSKSTIALQDTLTQLRNIADQIDPVQLGQVLGTLTTALEPGGRAPGSTIARLDNWLTAVDAAIPDLGADLQNFGAAAAGVNESMPELIDVLNSSVTTANTLVAERDNLVALLASAGGTVDTVNALFAANPNSGKELVVGLDNVFGAMAGDPSAITQTMVNLNNSLAALNTTFNWGPAQQMAWSMDLSFTPFTPYTRADCPRYGDMAGPSCATAPIGSNPGVLPSEMLPRRLDTAGPAPVAAPEVPAIPAPQVPALPQLPNLPLPNLQLPAPQLPQLPGLQLPNVPLPQLPGATPANATTPASVRPGGLRGQAAVQALSGHRANATQLMLLGAALKGGALYPVSTTAVTDGGVR
ncbi:MCE family protein [Aldersonia sp. NBC_00410]|uniref:MlaD family protein n=1 Tax=Aldersonia sp. NBC_00410 TaxID=2975954 RepID=UPI00225039E6|nr:MCE family protein [Aldersonia sp. NBC_00410]MCX5042987.1 MCE family protein [Aldersonia sp. NBC_00410]